MGMAASSPRLRSGNSNAGTVGVGVPVDDFQPLHARELCDVSRDQGGAMAQGRGSDESWAEPVTRRKRSPPASGGSVMTVRSLSKPPRSLSIAV
jgi:hypothetical protein